MLFANLFTFVSLSNVFYIWNESEKVAQSYLTLCNPMDCIVHGIFHGLEWLAFPFRGSSQPGIKLRSPTLQVDSLPAEPPGKYILYTHFRKKLGNCYDDLNCKRVKISVQFSSVAQSCLTLCNPMNRSTPGLPVHHQFPEFTQTHGRWCHPTISSSAVPFSSCLQSFPMSGSFPVSQFFTLGANTLQLLLQHWSFQWLFRVDFL